jgi:Type II secretion system (T2SS), protein E, N-terminal domain
MKLGEMLVRDGCMTREQLDRALARQALEGGRLGTILVEMGFIDADALTVYLGLELGIPISTGATFERAKRTAVRLLTPAQARHYRCIPLIVQDRQLIAAMEDPHDMEVLDELYRVTGYRVLPRVAPEIRIFYYLERYYGIPRPPRLAALGDSVRGRPPSRAAAARLPAPPLPGLPPLTEVPAPQPPILPIAMMRPAAPSAASAPPVPRSPSGTAGSSPRLTPPPGPPSPEGLALTSDAEDLVITLEADAADEAEEAPQASFEATQMSPADVPSPELPGIIQPMARDQVMATLASATRRGEVADAIISYAVGLFDVVALCVMRDNMAFGWKAVGPQLDRERIEALLIPLDAPSMFQSAMHKDNLFHEAPLPGTMHAYLYRVLRCQPPSRATVAAISIGKRVVNFLYGHRNGRQELSEAEVADLRSMCQAASEAYVKLIAASKRGEPAAERERPPGRRVSDVGDAGALEGSR